MSAELRKTLVLSPRFDEDSQALWRAALSRGWGVIRPDWRGPAVDVPAPVVYAGAMLGPMLAERVGLTLPEPPDDWLARLPASYAGRFVELVSMGHARKIAGSVFVKPPNDKSFPAAVYTGATLPEFVDDWAPVLISEVVRWQSEFRCFVLDRRVSTSSKYATWGEPAGDWSPSADEQTALHTFMATLLADPLVDLPRATVIDVGIIDGRGWAVVEQNAAWSAAIYGCDPSAALDVIEAAALSLTASDSKEQRTTECPQDPCATLHLKAQAVVDRWETPLWKDVPATARFIYELRDALEDHPVGE